MTVANTPRRAGPFPGDGATTTLPFSFKAFDSADVRVDTTDVNAVTTTLVLDTDYTLTLNGDQDSDPGGEVELSTPLLDGEVAVVLGGTPYTQALDLPSGGRFNDETIEQALDRLAFQTQQLAEGLSRAASVPTTAGDAESLNEAIAVLVANIDELTVVVDNIADLVTLASISADVTTLAALDAEIAALAAIGAAIATVADIAANVTTVAGIAANVTTVAGIAADVTTVAGISAAVSTVATNAAAVATAAANIAAIIAAPAEAAAAAASAAAASGSATAAGNSAVAAAASAASVGLGSTPASVASAGTTNLTTGAPTNANVVITGTTTITGFTVAAGRLLFARFAGSLTLTNNANIVTQRGANIVTQAGDTCILRATAANVVEVLSYREGRWGAAPGAAPMYACRAWANFDGTGTPAIRASGNVSSITDNGLGDYTVNFTTAMSDANYAAVIAATLMPGSGNVVAPCIGRYNNTITAKAASNCIVSLYPTGPGSGTAADSPNIDVAFFR